MMRRLASCIPLLLLSACGDDSSPTPALLDPNLSEGDLRAALGVPAHADRVLILSQTSHLDIDWKQTFDDYYANFVEDVFQQANLLLGTDARTFYSIAEMGFLSTDVAKHGVQSWPRYFATGHARIVGGGITSPDTLLTTTETLTRDYLLGTIFAENTFGAHPTAAWLPDSFGHSPTVPDLLSAAGYTSVGFGRVDGARHSYEILVGHLDPIAPGVTTTASLLRDMGTSDFVWRGPGGGEILAHYMPVREYCQGDLIDLDGYPIGGSRLGADHSKDPAFVKKRIGEFIDQLTPYEKTPYLFVPVGCDFQPPRAGLANYARWWNESRFAETGVWVTLATFEDYMRLVAFHRDALPVMARDIAPVWTGFYASRAGIKQLARAAAESLAGVEPFAELVEPGGDSLAAAWQSVVLTNHHDAITGTSSDTVATAEQLPRLEAAIADADNAWKRVLGELSARITTQNAGGKQAIVVVNPGPLDRDSVVEVDQVGTGPFVTVSEGTMSPAQMTSDGRVAFLARAVPAFGWRTFSLSSGSAAGATATLSADTATLSTGALDARFAHDPEGWSLASLTVNGRELLSHPSLEWVVYSDTGGLYRIGSERADCTQDEFAEAFTIRLGTLELLESGPARVTLRATTTVDGIPTTVDFVAAAGDDRLIVRATGGAARDRTVMLRVWPQAAGDSLTMGVPAGVATRPLSHLYSPSLWPAATWVARGNLAVALAQSTAVHGTADGALEWALFRNATSEQPCDDLGPMGTDDATLTEEFSLGSYDGSSQGMTETAASMALSRPMRAIGTDAHAGMLPSTGRLLKVTAPSALAIAIKPASRGEGLVLHLQRFGSAPADVSLVRGVLDWNSVTRPDLLERGDVPFGVMTADGADVTLDAAMTALRLRP